jgi:hypothetical protein
MKHINESVTVAKTLLREVSKNNDLEIKETEKLRIILLNLKIVGAGVLGITPIADALADIINNLHESTDKLVKEGREDLREAFRDMENYINEKEGKL